MPRVTHFYSHREEGESLIVYLPGEAKPFVALGDHPNFAGLKLAAEDDDLDTIIELRELAKSIAARFNRLGNRVTTRDRRLYFDGDEVHNTLTDQILKFYDEGEDFKPLVNLFERLAFNPSQNSKDQLYNWISNHNGITVMSDGRLVAYKGVSHGDAGNYRSTQQGHGFVNDVEYTNSYLPYALGDDVRMPRSEVVDDPYASCSTGLHVGTFEYAQTWSRSGVMLRVAVDPADVRSVPTDGRGEKIRVCRFTIEEIVNEPITALVFNSPEKKQDAPPLDSRGYLTLAGLYVGQHVTSLLPSEGNSYYKVTSLPDGDTHMWSGIFYDSNGAPEEEEDSEVFEPGFWRLHESSPLDENGEIILLDLGLSEDIFATTAMTKDFDEWEKRHPNAMPPRGYAFDGRKGEAEDFNEGDFLTAANWVANYGGTQTVWARGRIDPDGTVYGTCQDVGFYNTDSSTLHYAERERFPYVGLVKLNTPTPADAPSDDTDDTDECTECGCHLDYCTCGDGDEEYCCGECDGDCEDEDEDY